jgi:hypothetical protein
MPRDLRFHLWAHEDLNLGPFRVKGRSGIATSCANAHPPCSVPHSNGPRLTATVPLFPMPRGPNGDQHRPSAMPRPGVQRAPGSLCSGAPTKPTWLAKLIAPISSTAGPRPNGDRGGIERGTAAEQSLLLRALLPQRCGRLPCQGKARRVHDLPRRPSSPAQRHIRAVPY